MAKPPKTHPRNLTKRLRIEKNEATEGSSGVFYDEAPSWVEYMTVWAEIAGRGTRKLWQARQIHEEATHVVTIHWRPDVDIAQEIRFRWTDRADYTHTAYTLGPPVNDANRWFEFACVEQVT